MEKPIHQATTYHYLTESLSRTLNSPLKKLSPASQVLLANEHLNVLSNFLIYEYTAMTGRGDACDTQTQARVMTSFRAVSFEVNV